MRLVTGAAGAIGMGGDGRRPGLRRRHAIATAGVGAHAELLDIALPVLRAYTTRHWLDLVTVRHDTAFGRPPAWGKLPIIHGLLDHYDVVVWIDADAMIVDLERNILHELRATHDLYLVQHLHDDGQITLNTGVMMVRSTGWARELLAQAWAMEDLVEHPWWENAAIMRLLGYRVEVGSTRPLWRSRWMERTQILGEIWDSFPGMMPPPVIHHYAGKPFEERRARMLADRVDWMIRRSTLAVDSRPHVELGEVSGETLAALAPTE